MLSYEHTQASFGKAYGCPGHHFEGFEMAYRKLRCCGYLGRLLDPLSLDFLCHYT